MYIVSYTRDGKHFEVDSTCDFYHQSDDGILLYKLNTAGGYSGAVVFAKTNSGLYPVAVHSSGHMEDEYKKQWNFGFLIHKGVEKKAEELKVPNVPIGPL